jgi:hypothetical protein
VLEDPAARAELARIGARSIPVLSRGDEFVFAQNIAQVVQFLKLDEKTGPVLSPAQLVERLLRFIDVALRIIPQMPDDKLDNEVPNRPRRYRVLAHHMFRIPEAFFEITEGTEFTQGLPTAIPNEADMASGAALASYGRKVRDKVARWWESTPDKSCGQIVETYYGPQQLHEVLERTTWHIGQHTRQWNMLLGMAGVKADYPLGDADFADLPMPKKVWDD